LSEELTVVVVLNVLTTDWLRVDEVLARLFESPEYWAVIEIVAADANEVV
jgi:hypothetical protein